MSQPSCMHISQIREVMPSAEGCEDCLKTGVLGAPLPLPNLNLSGMGVRSCNVTFLTY
jgi:hypothetical protein